MSDTTILTGLRASRLPAIKSGKALHTGKYEMQRGDRKITLIGMCHIGLPQYYDAVLDLITQRSEAGSALHYEAIVSTVRSDVAEDEQRSLNDSDRSYRVMQEGLLTLLGRFGLVGQQVLMRKLSVLPRSKNIDISLVEALRSMGPRPFGNATKSLDIESMDETMLKILSTVFMFVFRRLSFFSAISKLTTRGRASKDMHARREDLAIAAALDEAAERDVTLIWGAAHLPGMVRQLRNSGFHLVDVDYLRAI